MIDIRTGSRERIPIDRGSWEADVDGELPVIAPAVALDWSPDGARIANVDGVGRIFVFDLETSSATKVPGLQPAESIS